MLATDVLAEAAANIVFTTGGASIIAADGAVRRAERGAVINAGETVDTADGKVQLRFRDGATMSLQPGTQFRVEQFRFAEQGGKAGPDDTVVMRFIRGALRTVSGLIGKEKREQYRMDTAVGTIGIRGTDYGANMGDSGLSVTTYGGLVEVCNQAGCGLVGPGQTLVVGGAGDKPKLQGPQGPSGGMQGNVPGAGGSPDLPPPQQSIDLSGQQQQQQQQGPRYMGPPVRGY